jgi:peptidyl-prolyl cis-trans isomerase SurA
MPVRCWPAALALALCLSTPWAAAQQAGAPGSRAAQATNAVRGGDHILVVINQEVVTARELEQRLALVRESAARNGTSLPPAAELRRQVLDMLIDERVQVTHARETGQRIDDVELDRAVANVAQQNQITLAQLRERLRADGIEFNRFRNNLRDQILIERVREREMQSRIRITDAEVDALIERQRAAAGAAPEYNIAQILIKVPEGASDAVISERRARAEAALARVKAGTPFAVVAREVSEDDNKANGGVIGMRPADRLPDVFVEQIRGLRPGELAPAVLRTGAGFHVLQLTERREGGELSVTQTRARHILLRPSDQLPQPAAVNRLQAFKRQLVAGAKTFDQLARENSQDASAPQGGDLGWTSPGAFVPEFEEAMNALGIGGISDPVVSRFGVHLIQVVERRRVAVDPKQLREQARNRLREEKFDEAYAEWLRELRAQAYVEFREALQ